ncbi:MAG TPA: FAD-binding oxidoreductase [Thermoanaerobaculia bacterium]|nr:FAD-binding oxidoreductase [Thermoanaerobaculia bacterium]
MTFTTEGTEETEFSVPSVSSVVNIVSPATLEECSEALRSKHRIAFAGGNTERELGNPPNSIDTEVRTDRLKRIVDYSPSDMVLTAEAGVTLAEINAVTREQRQMLALDPPHADRATIGGLVATAGFGPRRARYGAIRDLIIGVTLVRADGVVARGGGRVVKNVAGFDLPKLACGSLGTLAMIAEATFRLHPLPEKSATAVYRGLTAEKVFATTKMIRDKQLEPSSVVASRIAPNAYDLGIRFEGFSKGVDEQMSRLGKVDEEFDFGAARSGGPTRVRIAALPSRFAEVANVIEALHPAAFAWYATAGIGFVECGGHAAALIEAREKIGSLIVESGNPGIEAWGSAGSAFPIMRNLKQRFDPERRLNPGRFVGGL